TLAEQVSTHQTDFSNKLSDMQKVVEETTSALTTLREQLSTQDSRSERRPLRPAITAQNKPPIADGAKAQ
ncbi:hypothetical protein NY478_23450, partial [Enterobacter hormaechei]|nr:hypothetical protein [Enterobacter hormaechei]